MEPFLQSLRAYSGCCIHRLSLNTVRHGQSLLEASQGIAKGSCHTSARNKTSAAFYTFSKLSLSTQLDVYSPCPVNLPVSRRYAPAAQIECCRQNTISVTFCTKVHTLWLSFLAIFYNCRHSSSRQLAVRSNKLSCTKILFTFRMQPAAIVLNYSVKNIWNNVHLIIIYKNHNSTHQ